LGYVLLISVVRTYFNVHEDIKIHNCDESDVLDFNDKKYYIIFFVAYSCESIPYHMVTKEFFELFFLG